MLTQLDHNGEEGSTKRDRVKGNSFIHLGEPVLRHMPPVGSQLVSGAGNVCATAPLRWIQAALGGADCRWQDLRLTADG